MNPQNSNSKKLFICRVIKTREFDCARTTVMWMAPERINDELDEIKSISIRFFLLRLLSHSKARSTSRRPIIGVTVLIEWIKSLLLLRSTFDEWEIIRRNDIQSLFNGKARAIWRVRREMKAVRNEARASWNQKCPGRKLNLLSPRWVRNKMLSALIIFCNVYSRCWGAGHGRPAVNWWVIIVSRHDKTAFARKVGNSAIKSISENAANEHVEGNVSKYSNELSLLMHVLLLTRVAAFLDAILHDITSANVTAGPVRGYHTHKDMKASYKAFVNLLSFDGIEVARWNGKVLRARGTPNGVRNEH